MQPVVAITAEAVEALSTAPKPQPAFRPISSFPNPQMHQLGHTGRNQRCPCKSGKKFKQCCLARAKEATRIVTCATCKQAFHRYACNAGIPEHKIGHGIAEHTCPGSGEIVK